MDILCRLVDKLRFNSAPSNIMLLNFISISGTDCTCLFFDTSPSKHSSFSNNSSIFPLLFWRKLDRTLHLTTYTQHKTPVQLIINSQCYFSTFLCNTNSQNFLLEFLPDLSCMGVLSKSTCII